MVPTPKDTMEFYTSKIFQDLAKGFIKSLRGSAIKNQHVVKTQKLINKDISPLEFRAFKSSKQRLKDLDLKSQVLLPL